MKIKKQLWAIMMVCSLLFALMPSQSVNAAGSYRKAYKKLLKNIHKTEASEHYNYLRQYFGNVSFDHYFVYDLNKDGTPELFLYSGDMAGMVAIYTYSNKKAKFLGYNTFSYINKAKKTIIVPSHWHGAGGSGVNEWQIYDISKNKLRFHYFIDHNGDNGKYKDVKVVKNLNWAHKSTSKKKYKQIYKKYVKNATPIYKFDMYGVSNLSGVK